MIRRCRPDELPTVLEIINDAARAYRGLIPEELWHEPYMSPEELRREVASGIEFWGAEEQGRLLGVMGLQAAGGVTLIRHAYVRTDRRRQGIGGRLLAFLRAQTGEPLLLGTWRAATWALRFYERHGFEVLSDEETDRLLRRYWRLPEAQIRSSVVLADAKWRAGRGPRKAP